MGKYSTAELIREVAARIGDRLTCKEWRLNRRSRLMLKWEGVR